MPLQPLSPPYDDDVAALLATWMPPGVDVEPLALFRVLAVHPELAGRMRPMASGLLAKGLLPDRDRELLLLRTTARAGAEYEWGVHAVAYAPVVGIDEVVLAATARAGIEAVDAEDALLLRAADELHEGAALSDDVLAGLEARYTPAQLLELVTLCGWYRTLSAVISAARLEGESWGARFPAA